MRRGERKLKAKAMETWGLLLFFLDMVRKYAAQIGASAAVVWSAGNVWSATPACASAKGSMCQWPLSKSASVASVATRSQR